MYDIFHNATTMNDRAEKIFFDSIVTQIMTGHIGHNTHIRSALYRMADDNRNMDLKYIIETTKKWIEQPISALFPIISKAMEGRAHLGEVPDFIIEQMNNAPEDVSILDYLTTSRSSFSHVIEKHPMYALYRELDGLGLFEYQEKMFHHIGERKSSEDILALHLHR